jgi:hypothetical protein
MKHLKKLKTRMGNFQLKSLIGVATKRKGNDIEFDVVESVNEGGMGILDKDQTDVLHAIVMKNKNKNSKSILSIAMKDRMFKGVDKKELLGYIEGAKQFVKYMSMGRTGDESVSETKGRDYKAEYQARKSNYYEKYQSSTKAKKYRAELNQYNRKRGTYGNGDGMDASHKGGKIVGFEKESTNRSRREKSRLKKEGINEVRWPDTQTADLLSQAFKDAKVKVQKVWEKGNHEYIIRVRAKDGWTNVRMELNVVSNVIMLDTQSGHVRLGELQPGSRGRKLTKNLKMLSKLPSFGVAGFKGLKYKIESILKEDIGIETYLGGIVKALSRAGIKPKTAKQMKHGFSKSKDKIGFFIDVLDRKREKYTLQLEVDRDGNLWYLSALRPMKLGKWADTSKIVRSLKAISKLPDFGQSSLNRR